MRYYPPPPEGQRYWCRWCKTKSWGLNPTHNTNCGCRCHNKQKELEMGFLNDLGLENVEADPNYIPDGKYAAFVYESSTKIIKNVNYWVITYKIADDPNVGGKTVDELKSLDPKGPKRSQQLSFLKQRVLSLGIPESRVSEFDPGDVVGTPVTISIKHKDGYQNVGTVELRGEGTTPSVAPTNVGASVASSATGDMSSLL